MRLKDKVCIITGAASGIGKAATLLFLKEGAKVAACDVSEQALENLKIKAESEGLSEGLKTYKLDVTDREAIANVVKDIVDTFGRIDVLVNNVNLKGVFNMTQAVVPQMIKQNKGSIINTSSVVGIYGNIGQTNYAATKAGVIGMTKTWAKELARKGAQVRVNAVAPGFIKTPMTEKIPQKIVDRVVERIPLGRFGEPEEVARVYLFLASDESNYITGQVIGVDGGLTL